MGSGPLVRTGVASGSAYPDPLFVMYQGNRLTTPEGNPVTLDDAVGATGSSAVVFADAAALNVAKRRWRQLDRRATQSIDAASALAYAGCVMVLTRSLAQKYWAPTPTGSWTAWAAWFGLSQLGVRQQLETLYGHCTNGSTIPDVSLRVFRSPYEDGFQRAVSVSEVYNHQLHLDPISRDEYLESGEVVEMTEVENLGGLLRFKCTPACKLRGAVTMFDEPTGEPQKTAEVTLKDLSWDPTAKMLLGKVTFTSNNRRAWDLLDRHCWLTGAVMRRHPVTSGRRWSQSQDDQAPKRRRDVPLDIALAATL